MNDNKLVGVDAAVKEIMSLGNRGGLSVCPTEETLRLVIAKHCQGREYFEEFRADLERQYRSETERLRHAHSAMIAVCIKDRMEIANLKDRIEVQAETIQTYQTNPETEASNG